MFIVYGQIYYNTIIIMNSSGLQDLTDNSLYLYSKVSTVCVFVCVCVCVCVCVPESVCV